MCSSIGPMTSQNASLRTTAVHMQASGRRARSRSVKRTTVSSSPFATSWSSIWTSRLVIDVSAPVSSSRRSWWRAFDGNHRSSSSQKPT